MALEYLGYAVAVGCFTLFVAILFAEWLKYRKWKDEDSQK